MNYFPNSDRALPASAVNLLTEDRQRLPVSAPAPVPASVEEAAAAGQVPETLLMAAQRHGKQLLAGWATSFLLHFLLLAVLALVTLSGASSELGLELSFSDSVDSVEFQDVQFDLPALDDPASSESLESLLVPEEQADESALELADMAIEPAVEMESLLAVSMLESESLSSAIDQPMSASEFEGVGGGTSADSDSGAKFYGIESEGNRFVYVIDASTSMEDGGRWGRAVEELLESISQLKSSQRFLVLTYSSSFRAMMDMPMNQIDLVKATRGNKRRLETWLYRQRPGGVTMPAGAMMVGLSLNVDAIYLLSDGLLMDRTDAILRQNNRPRLLRFGGGRKTPVHTIGMDVSGEGADLLQVIAEENAGIYRVVN